MRALLSRPLRRSAALLTAAVLATFALVAVPMGQSAQAGIYNPIPFGIDELPTYDFTDADALLAYVTSDIKGGVICVVPETIENIGDGDCSDKAPWSTPNTIVGIGSHIQLIEDNLVPGNYRLLTQTIPTEVNPDVTVTGVGEVFTVTPCPDCDRFMTDAVVAQWKAMAAQNTIGATLYCNVQDAIKKGKDAGKKIKDQQEPKKWALEGGGFSVTYTPGGIGGGGIVLGGFDPFERSKEKALEILKDLSCAVSTMYNDIVNDPPDPAFDQVEVPDVYPVEGIDDPASLTLAEQLAAQYALGNSSLTAFERYLGAVEAGDSEGVIRQLNAAADLSFQLADSLRSSATALDSYATAAEADPYLSALETTQGGLDLQATIYQRVQQNGFTAEEIAAFTAAGMSAEDIARFALQFTGDPSSVTPGRSLSDYSRDTAETLRSTADGFQEFGVQAAIVAARNLSDVPPPDAAPTAVIAATPTGGTAPLAVHFDGSASSDPEGALADWTWDFGDGTTGSGATVDHLYAVGGDYTAVLTVTDAAGLTASDSTTVTVAEGPVAAFSVTPAVGVTPVAAHFDASASTAPAGITDYRWDFGDGTSGTGVAVDHVYASPPTEPTVSLTVTDANGAVTSTTQPVAYRDPSTIVAPVCGDQDDGSIVTGCTAFTRDVGRELWQVQGDGAVDVTFDTVYVDAGQSSQLSAYTVDDADGTVDGIRPGAAGYSQAVLERARTVFERSDPGLPDAVLGFQGGDRVAFYISASSNEQLAEDANPGGAMLFSLAAANIDLIGHSLAFSDADGVAQFSFEDLPGGGDGDFDDLIFTARGFTEAVPTLVANPQSVSTSTDVPIEITLTGASSTGITPSFTPADPDFGSLSATGTNTVLYTPSAGFAGTDAFTFTASAGGVTSLPATVSITVVEGPLANRPPVLALPAAAYADEGSAPAVPLSYSDADGTVVLFVWTASTGATASGPAFVDPPSFGDDGEYQLTLTIVDDDGASTSATTTVTVRNVAPTVGDLGAVPGRAAPGFSSAFHLEPFDPGVADAPTVTWDFGDGGTATGVDVVHEWGTAAGSYTVTATLEDKDGAQTPVTVGTVDVGVVIVDAGPARTSPEGAEVTFDFSGSTDIDAQLSYAVDFGDGTTQNLSDLQPVHRYARFGSYTVVLTATDRLDRPDDDPAIIVDSTTVTVTAVAPTVSGVAHSEAVAGQPSSLHVFWTDPGGVQGAAVDWEFDDGAVATGPVTSHTFATAGEHTVRVAVTDDAGSVARFSRTVQVVAEPTASGASSAGTDFWIDFDANHENSTTTRALTLFVSGAPGTAGEVEIPGIGFTTAFTVPAAGVAAVDIPLTALVGMTEGDEQAERIEPRAIHLTADAEVTVYGLNRAEYTTDAYLALPTAAAATRFRVTDYDSFSSGLLSVVATAGTTVVHVEPAASVALPAFDVTLEMGEVFEWEPRGSGSLTGSVVTADRPVSVFAGNRCTQVPSGVPACDHIIEQMTPTASWGETFVTYPLFSRTQDTFRILADADGTTVTVQKASGDESFVLAAGEFHEMLSGEPMTIRADHPVSVAQFSNSSGFDNVVSDPFMVMVPPFEQGFTDSTFSTPTTGFTNYVNITAPTVATGEVQLDGAVLDAALWTAIPGSDYSGAAVPIEAGVHRITSASPVGTVVYGFAEYDSYGFPGGTRLAAVAEVSSLVLTPASASTAVGDELCTVAQLRDGSGGGIAGARVDVVTTGLVSRSFSVVTDGSGNAPICLDPDAEGSVAVTASVGAVSASATLTWSDRPSGNRAPVAVIAMPASALEGSSVTADAGGSSDPDGDALSYAWDLDGDGAYDDAATATAVLPLPLVGSYPVALRVTDAAGLTGAAGATVVAVNVVPVVTIPSPIDLGTGLALDLAGGFADPGADGWTATVDWGEGAGPEPLPLHGFAFELQHTFAAPGSHVVTVTVTDAAGASTGTASLTVLSHENGAPVVRFGGAAGVEGAIIPLVAPASDPDGDAVTLAWSVSSVATAPGAVPGAAVASCVIAGTAAGAELRCDDDASVVVAVRASDGSLEALAEGVVLVRNAPPVVGAATAVKGTDAGMRLTSAVTTSAGTTSAMTTSAATASAATTSAVTGSAATASAAPDYSETWTVSADFTDAGARDTFRCAVDLDGLRALPATLAGSGCVATAEDLGVGSHVLTVTVTDDDGGVGSSAVTIAVLAPGDPTPTPTPTVTPDPTPGPTAAPAPGASPAPGSAADPSSAAPSPSSLSSTGSAVALWAGVAVLVLAAGILIAVLARRRRRQNGDG